MATEIAALGLKADSSGVVQATGDLRKLATEAVRAEAAADGLAKGTGRLRDEKGRFIPVAKRAGDEVRRVGDEERRAAGEADRLTRSTGNVTGSLERMVAMARRATGVLAAAFTVNAVAQAADGWSDMQSVVGAAIGDMERAPAVMQDINRLARASYSSLNQTANGFARNVQSLRDLGYSTQGALDYTEALNNALVITATRSDRAASVQDQLSKAMATGRLQADGLETVLANGGRVAQALADELGTTVSGLRQMATDGKITGTVIASALTSNLAQLKAEAEEMPATLADAQGQLGRVITYAIGQIDQATQASGRLAMGLLKVTDAVGDFAENRLGDVAEYAGKAMTGLAQMALVLAATRLPALTAAAFASASGITAAGVSSSLMTAQFIAGAAAARGLTVATAALNRALALVGGPVGALILGAGSLAIYLRQTRTEASDLASTMGELEKAATDTQRSLELYRTNRNQETTNNALAAVRTELEQVQNRAQVAAETVSSLREQISLRAQFGGDTSGLEAQLIAANAALDEQVQKSQVLIAQRSMLSDWAEIYAQQQHEQNVRAGALTTEQQRSLSTLQSMLADQTRSNDLRAAEARYGKDSAQALAVQHQHERDILDAKLDSLAATLDGVDGVNDIVTATRQALAAQQGAEAGARRWAAAMAEVRGTLNGIAGVLASLGGGYMDRVSMTAQRNILAAGGSAADARRAGIHAREDEELRARQTQLRGQLGSAVGGFMGRALELERDQRRAMEAELEAAYTAAETRASGGGGGGRGSGGGGGGTSSVVAEAEKRADAINGVVKSLQDEIDMIGASEIARRTHAELQRAGVNAYSAEGQQISDMVEQLMRAEEQQRRLVDATQNGQRALESLFGSVIDGSKSGKEAVLDLIAQITRVQAMNAIFQLPGMGGLGRTLGSWLTPSYGGFGGGDALSGALAGAGLSVPSFEGGGWTGDAPRSGGLDGRGGYLAMVHPREKIRDTTKGGDGQGQGGGQSLSVGISFDDVGGIRAVVRNEAGAVLAAAESSIIGRSVAASGRAMGQTKKFGNR